MKPARAVFVLTLVFALLLGLGLGWLLRSEDSLEGRAHQAAERMRNAIRSLTR